MHNMDSGHTNQLHQHFSFIESTQEAIEDEMNPTGIFLDLTKAYDV